MIWLFAVQALVNAAEPGPHARAAFSLQDAKTYSGHITNLGFNQVTESRWNLGVNADLLSRTYGGGVTVTDDQFGVSASRAITERAYVDAAATAASTANIYARWSAAIAPHYVYNATDYGLGLKYAEYRLTRVGVLNPSVFHYFKNGLSVGAGTNIIRTDEYIQSFSAQVLYTNAHHAVRVGGGVGRALEDAGLTAHFNTLSAEYLYTFSSRWSVGLGATDYWSQVRRERAIGLRLGWR